MKKVLTDRKMLSLCTVIVLVLCSGVLADDLRPPDWRGHNDSTFQLWEFSTNELQPPIPDLVNNRFGEPLLRVTPSPGGEWDPDFGAWPLSGEIDVYIPNLPEIRPYKEIWVQLTWMPTSIDPFLPDMPVVGVTPFDSIQMTRGDDINLDNGWTHSLFMLSIWPNPVEEWITIKGDIKVDQLVIDTICIPEPITVILLGIGGALALKRKKHAR